MEKNKIKVNGKKQEFSLWLGSGRTVGSLFKGRNPADKRDIGDYPLGLSCDEYQGYAAVQ